MGIELDSMNLGAKLTGSLRVTKARRTIAWLRIQRYMQKDPAFRSAWWDKFEQAVTQITEAVTAAVNKGETVSQLDIKSPVPDGMNPVEAGTVFVWRAQLVAQQRLGHM